MATVHVTLSVVDDRASTGASLPVINSVPVAAQTLASAAASAVGNVTASKADGLFWSVTAKGGDVWVAFGANPVAASGSGHLILAGQTRDFSVAATGEKIAVKDA
jgi:hypothetical protein